jgi:hypothetical protein
MARYVESSDFLTEAENRFQFLHEEDFLGPEEGEYWLSYSSGMLGVEVHYDDSEGRVITIVRSSVGDRNPRASLQCLYVSAKLGPAQHIKEIVRSAKVLGYVLESHAVALRKVLPVVEGAGGLDLLLDCHGR